MTGDRAEQESSSREIPAIIRQFAPDRSSTERDLDGKISRSHYQSSITTTTLDASKDRQVSRRLAIVAYTPTASALIADLAPSSLRGVYTSINSLCWAAGYAIGPPLGGWALDRSPQFAHNFWLGLAATVPLVWAILWWLEGLVGNSDGE